MSITLEKAVDEARDIRHRLHQIPEVGYTEVKTAAMIREQLDRLKIPHTDGVTDAPTATIGLIGDPRKPCIALRADIDALPIVERTGVAYTSQHDGRMHACGHDGHMANLLGSARVLQGMADKLNVCVKLLFQPAEEGGGGALKLTNAGVLDGRIGPKVSAVFGMHGWPGLPQGVVSTRPGPLLAATDTVSCIFRATGGHAALPHLTADPTLAAAHAVVSIQQVTSRDLDPTESAVVTITMLHAGNKDNVIPDQSMLLGTVRTLTQQTRTQMPILLERRCRAIAAAENCEYEFTWDPGYPPTINDPAMADYIARIARQSLGELAFLPAARPTMGGEDFAYYLEQVPGAFFFLGMLPPGHQSAPSLHNDMFDFNDAVLPVGIKMFVELVRNFEAS